MLSFQQESLRLVYATGQMWQIIRLRLTFNNPVRMRYEINFWIE